MPLPDNEVYEIIKGIRDKTIPTSEVIVQQAFSSFGLTKASPLNPTGKTPEDIIQNFNSYLCSVFVKSLEVLESYESLVYPLALRQICARLSNELAMIEQKKPQAHFADKVADSLDALYPNIWCVFLSRSQSRKQRGGKDFEQQVGQLLKLADIPFDKQIRKYHSDFMLPSAKAFNNDRMRSILISAKRTLRERWQNVVNEIHETKCPNAFLCTADNEIAQSVIDRLREYNIYLVIWDRQKEERFKDESIVVSYSEFANKQIQTFRGFWAK